MRGKAALRDCFAGYLARLGSLRLVSTEQFAATDDAIFFEATAETAHGVARVDDAFALRDGKATHHFAGVLAFPPHDPAPWATAPPVRAARDLVGSLARKADTAAIIGKPSQPPPLSEDRTPRRERRP